MTLLFFLMGLLGLELLICEKTHLSKPLPLVFYFNWFCTPLVTDYLRDLWIGKSRMVSDDMGLIVLPIENKSCKYESIVVLETTKKGGTKMVGVMQPAVKKHKEWSCHTPFLGRGILGSGWQRHIFAPPETLLMVLALVRVRSPKR
jgi:hypothetical protein